jgi:hypothetical protein
MVVVERYPDLKANQIFRPASAKVQRTGLMLRVRYNKAKKHTIPDQDVPTVLQIPPAASEAQGSI